MSAAVADLGRPLTFLRADGGLTRFRLLVQAQADLLQVPVLVYRSADATAFGVAALAGSAPGTCTPPPRPWGQLRWNRGGAAITADEAAERLVAFRSALPLALAGR